MPVLNLTIGNEKIEISTGDLARGGLARFNNAGLLVSDALRAVGNQPFSALNTSTLEVGFSADRELSWQRDLPAGGALTITFTPEVEGRVVLRKSGELFRYTTSAEESDEAPVHVVEVPAGKAYVSILLRVSLQAGAAAAFSHGAFGVKGAVGTENRFLLACHFCCDSSDLIQEAVVQAFRRFVLPFGDDAAARLKELDYVEYEFFGKLSFAIGATAGFQGVFFGGLSNGALARTFQSELGSLTVKAQPSFTLGAALDVKWTHEDAYRIVLGVPDAARVSLFLFKMDTSRLSTTLTLSAGVKIGAAVAIEARVDALIRNAAERAFAGVPDPLRRNELVQRLFERIKASPEALNRFIQEAGDRANGFLQNLERLNVTATIGSERISERTALFTYEFDRPLTGLGFALAMAGDFAGALAQPGVRLGAGSFVSQSLVHRTSIALVFFEAFRVATVTEYLQKSEVIYAGGGVFEFRFTAGLKASSDFFGHQKAVEMHFIAAAQALQGGVLRDQDVRFFLRTQESRNEKAALQTAGMLELLLPGQGVDSRLREALQGNPDVGVQVSCQFPLAALKRLPFTPYGPDGKPPALPHAQDAMNYRAFVEAVDLLFDHGGFQGQGFPNAVEKFAAWAHYNITAIDREGEMRPPDRRQHGNLDVRSRWPQSPLFPAAGLDAPLRFLVQTYLLAAQAFLNLCEDLNTLARGVEDAATLAAFNEVLEASKDLIKKDNGGHPLHFTKPLVVALAQRMNARPGKFDVAAPAAGEFAVRIEFA